MIAKSDTFDALVASVTNGTNFLMPSVARSYCVKGYSFHLEASLSENAKALRVMERLESPDVRYFYPRSPAKHIRGPICIVSMLHHGRLVELFCAEVHGGMVVLAIYNNDALAAYQLIDRVRRSTAS